MVLRTLLAIALLLLPAVAQAGPASTRAALDRLEEILELRLDDGLISPDDVMPTLLVSALPRYEASADWYVTGVIEVLERSFGSRGLRLCEACMVPRAFVDVALRHSTPNDPERLAAAADHGGAVHREAEADNAGVT